MQPQPGLGALSQRPLVTHAPVDGSQVATHSLDLEHVFATPVQVPARHTSPSVQSEPSSHRAPSATGSATHRPDCPSQRPTRQPWVSAEQSTCAPPHWPATQVSPLVQGRWSSQRVPSASGVVPQVPVVSTHWLVEQTVAKREQSSGVPRQVPLWHVSLMVQRTPSLQMAPFAFGCVAHWPVVASQLATTQEVGSTGQAFGTPRHVPATQRSLSLHPFPSSQLPDSLALIARQARSPSSHTP